MDKKLLQTQFSFQATSLSESFGAVLGRIRVGPYGYAPDMTAPDGPSTGGGVQGLQHLRLVPPEPSLPTLVVGSVSMRDHGAELRTLEHLDAICRERFQQGAPLDPQHYMQFVQSAQSFLAACGMRVALVGPPPELLARLAEPSFAVDAPRRASAGTIAGVAVGVLLMLGALGAALAWFFK